MGISRNGKQSATGIARTAGRTNRKLAPGDDFKIWQLYYDGATQQEIANQFDIAQQRVSQILEGFTVEVNERTRDEVHAVVMQHYLDLIATYAPRARKGNEGAARILLDVMQDIRKLYGLDNRPGHSLAEIQASMDAVRYIIESDSPDGEDITKALT